MIHRQIFPASFWATFNNVYRGKCLHRDCDRVCALFNSQWLGLWGQEKQVTHFTAPTKRPMNEWWLSRHLKTMNEGLNERFSASSVVAAPLWHPTRTNSPRVCGTPWQGSPQIQIQVMYKYKYNGLGTVWQQSTPNTALVHTYLQQTQWEARSGVNILSRNTIMGQKPQMFCRIFVTDALSDFQQSAGRFFK